MRTRLRSAALLAIAGALVAGIVTPAAATTAATTWSPDLAAGEAAGVRIESGTARLDPASAFTAPVDDGGSAESAPGAATGLLTLAPRTLPAATARVGAAVHGSVPAGSTASVDVRGRRESGGWSEWIPAGRDGAELPEPASEVQGRLVLTGRPAIDSVTLTAFQGTRTEARPAREQAPLTYRVFGTREGLVGGTTSNGHEITERDHFVALPSRRALAPRGSSDYSVKVCAPNGRCAFAPVWDVGPWNTRDDYWNPGPQREDWNDLPQGLPQAQAAFKDGYNDGRDQFDREVRNPAGIDLADGVFWDALGLTDNTWLRVDYLWTGSVRLSEVGDDAPYDVLAAPDADAKVVGLAAQQAAVPVECVLSSTEGSWLRIGHNQYLAAAAVPDPGPVRACDRRRG